MKTTITILLLFISLISYSQNTTQTCMYLVGSDKVQGYDIKIQSCEVKIDASKTITNAPVMLYFEQNKDLYIGGILENEKREKTKIKNITTTTSTIGEYTITSLVIEGKKFNKTLKTSEGYILSNESSEVIFYDTKGIWKIHKKKK